MNTNAGLIGRKVGMTQIFTEDGIMVPVTVVEAGPNVVLQVKSTATKDKYNAIQVGFGSQKAHRLSKAQLGHLAKTQAKPVRVVRELRLKDVANYQAGQTLTVGEVFKPGQKVDVAGISKGRGFAGVMKRHHFKGFIRSHGTHEYFRHGGSIGTRLTPGMVAKGRKMGGHLGAERVTVQNVTVVKVDPEQNLLFIKGGVPGATGGVVSVRATVKNVRQKKH